MKTVTTCEVQHHFGKILDELTEDEEVLVTRRGEPVAQITAVKTQHPLETTVFWQDLMELRMKRLEGLPETARNAVLEERKSYRY